jgi:hypothetical protein
MTIYNVIDHAAIFILFFIVLLYALLFGLIGLLKLLLEKLMYYLLRKFYGSRD